MRRSKIVHSFSSWPCGRGRSVATMHDRMVRGRFWRDEELGELGTDGALLFAGLWAMADDFGCLEDKPSIIHAEVFMVFDVPRERTRELLERLIELDKVRRYRGDD